MERCATWPNFNERGMSTDIAAAGRCGSQVALAVAATIRRTNSGNSTASNGYNTIYIGALEQNEPDSISCGDDTFRPVLCNVASVETPSFRSVNCRPLKPSNTGTPFITL